MVPQGRRQVQKLAPRCPSVPMRTRCWAAKGGVANLWRWTLADVTPPSTLLHLAPPTRHASWCSSQLFLYKSEVYKGGGAEPPHQHYAVHTLRRVLLLYSHGLPHMDSNSSTRRLVLPWRICLRVLYLSRPCLTFSAWSSSFFVVTASSRRSLPRSAFSIWKQKVKLFLKIHIIATQFLLLLNQNLHPMVESVLWNARTEKVLATHFWMCYLILNAQHSK